jgi:hypothetical protein
VCRIGDEGAARAHAHGYIGRPNTHKGGPQSLRRSGAASASRRPARSAEGSGAIVLTTACCRPCQ